KIIFLERIYRNGDVVWQGYSDSTRSNSIAISFEDHASGYPGNYMIFTGDFNGDGYDDLLVKNGDRIREGEWYISYNTKNLSFTRGHKVWFGNDSILHIPKQ
ncbi:MAG: FG-GAP repeat protein, partial [Bacteroidetes bacterium]|nr:FG-GAP repeat protein [Bacteroidota bacterium]